MYFLEYICSFLKDKASLYRLACVATILDTTLDQSDQ